MFEVRYFGGRKRGFCPQPAQMQKETWLPTVEWRWHTHHTRSAPLFGGIICGFILYYTPRQNFIQESRCPLVTSPASHYASVRAHWPTATRPWSEASWWRHSSHCGGVKEEDWITPNFYNHFYSAPLWEKQSDIKKHFFSLRAQRCGPLVQEHSPSSWAWSPRPRAFTRPFCSGIDWAEGRGLPTWKVVSSMARDMLHFLTTLWKKYVFSSLYLTRQMPLFTHFY